MRRSTFVPLTLRGFFMLALSLAVLAAGILRTDMAGLFWGSSFLLVVLYAWAGNAFTRILTARGRKKPGFLEVGLPVSVISPGEEASARVAATVPRVLVPGFSVVFSLPLSWHERRIDTVRAVLSPGANDRTMVFRAESRGSYAAAEARIEVRDILGLTASAVPVPLVESLKVFPRVPRDAERLRPEEEGGDSVRFAARRRRSEELLEVRKYFPGDDIRKLNWKVFAHMRELFLRVGEETPPPESRFLFILDSTENPAVPARAAMDCLDGLVEACASAMSVSLAQGAEVLFIASGSEACRRYDEESRADLMAALSDVWWSDPDWAPKLPARTRMHAVVFSTPGSPSLARITAAVANKGWRKSLFVPELPPAPEGWKPRSLRDLLLVPEESR